MRLQIRFVGAGGQGAILAGDVLMHAVIHEGKHAVAKPTYTSQVRGGATLSDIIIDADEIHYPCTIPGEIDFMLATAQPSFQRFRDGIKKGGTIVIDPNLVQPSADDLKTWKFFRVPIVEIASETGVPQTQSAVALGVAVKFLGCVREESALAALLEGTPAKYAEVNKRAFALGLQYAEEAIAKLEEKK